MGEVIKTMTIYDDRYVTPTFHMDATYQNLGIMIPALDDACAVYLDFAPRHHHFNYPARPGGYAANNIVFEMDMMTNTVLTGNPDGIIDNVNNVYMPKQGNPAQVTGGAPGQGQGIIFDGDADAFDILVDDIPDGILPTTNDFSIEIVIDATTGKHTDVLFGCKDGAFGGAGIGWSLQLDSSEKPILVIDDGTASPVTVQGDTDVATGVLVHLIASCVRAGNGTMYLNGVANGADAISSAPLTLKPPVDVVATRRLYMGGDAARGASENYWGNINFVRIYNKALTAAEAKYSYNVLMGKGFPGWVPLVDPLDGDDLVISKSGSAPNYFDLTPFVTTLPPIALRARCASEQVSSVTNLPFVFIQS